VLPGNVAGIVPTGCDGVACDGGIDLVQEDGTDGSTALLSVLVSDASDSWVSASAPQAWCQASALVLRRFSNRRMPFVAFGNNRG
jgi:hypothetical protein